MDQQTYDDFEPVLYERNENHSTVTQSNSHIEENPAPVDKYNLVYIAFYFIGTAILIPWCFFLMCNDYWMYKFRDTHKNWTFTSNDLHSLDADENRTKLQVDFMSYVSIAATVPGLIFLFVNIFFLTRYSAYARIMISSSIMLVFFGETTGLVLVNTDTWQIQFFYVTLVTVVIITVAMSVQQPALTSIFMRFPVEYISAASSGSSLSGVLAALAQILTLYVSMSPTVAVFLYFMFANMAIVTMCIAYMVVRQTEFFQHFTMDECNYRRLAASPVSPLRGSSVDYYKKIMKKTWIPISSTFICYAGTCAIYPSIAVLVCSVNMGVPSKWNEEYFVPVLTYLLYSVFEYFGRLLAGIVQRPQGTRMFVLSILRIVFVPLLMLCNAQPRHYLPVVIDSDFLYATIISAMAFSNGYLTTNAFIIIPKLVHLHEQETASTMLLIGLAGGLAVGSLLSYPLITLL